MTRDKPAPTIVSITPIAVENDSRTIKQAASIARLGYRSVVVEGKRSSSLPEEMPFAIRFRRNVARARIAKRTEAAQDTVSWVQKIWRFVSGNSRSVVVQAVTFLGFLTFYVMRFVVIGFFQLPRASLYYLHEFSFFPAVYLRCRIYRTPYIYDAHDFYSRIERPINQTAFQRRWLVPFQRWIERACVRHAAAVVTVSEGLAALYATEFGRSAIVLRNSHDERLDSTAQQDLRQSLGLSADVFLLVIVGNCKSGQRLSQALQAMTRLPRRVHLALVGRGYEKDFGAQIEQLGLRDRVHAVGSIRPWEIVPFIRSADSSLILYYDRSVSYEYCLPNGFFQSVAADLPVLYPRLPEIERICERLGLGVAIDPLSPSNIANAVDRLLEDPDGLLAYRRTVQSTKRELSWEQDELLLHKLVCDVLALPRDARLGVRVTTN